MVSSCSRVSRLRWDRGVVLGEDLGEAFGEWEGGGGGGGGVAGSLGYDGFGFGSVCGVLGR